MKSTITALVISLLFSLFASLAYAQTATETGTTKKETAKEKLEARKETVETRKTLAQNRVADLKARIATREAALKARLATFKNRDRAEIVQRINDNLNHLNAVRVENANKFLAKLTEILNHLQERVDKKAGEGKDATAANTAIADAKGKIASASAAVASQSAVDYTLTVSTEGRVRDETMAMRNKFHNDWLAIRKLMGEAKDAVQSAIQIAVTTLGGRATP